MIKFISGRVACFLCKDEDSKDNYDLYEYAAYIILSSAFHIATVIILGLCFNLLAESLVFYFSFIAIRKFAGGYHAKTPTRCYLFSVLSSIIILYSIKCLNSISTLVIFIFIIIEFFCIVAILLISPLDTKNNPLNKKEKIIYKRLTLIISISILIISILCIFMGFRNMGCSMLFGIIMSTLVLIIRKIQAIKNKNLKTKSL